jgi:hypothetical protein
VQAGLIGAVVRERLYENISRDYANEDEGADDFVLILISPESDSSGPP